MELKFFDKQYFHNTLGEYIIVAGVFIVSTIIILLIAKLLLKGVKRRAAKSNKMIDSILIKGLEHTILPLIYICVLYFAVGTLDFPNKTENKIHTVFIFLLTFLGIRTIIGIIKIYLNSYFKDKTDGTSREKQISGIVNIFSFIIWSIGLIFLLDNVGFRVSTVIAGLGVGGIAIALAAQAILGDLFSYFVIFFDRPFEIGDFIEVGGQSGTVENIGIKTTRVRGIGGEQIVFSNQNLTSTQLHNYKRMERRRSLFTLRIDFSTPKQKLEEVPKIIKEIIDEQEKVTFERSHLASVGEYAYIFETVYYVDDPDYKLYMDIQQNVNIEICRQLAENQIIIATAPGIMR